MLHKYTTISTIIQYIFSLNTNKKYRHYKTIVNIFLELDIKAI